MKKMISLILLLALLLSFAACSEAPATTGTEPTTPTESTQSTTEPTAKPTTQPTTNPTTQPTTEPTTQPATEPTEASTGDFVVYDAQGPLSRPTESNDYAFSLLMYIEVRRRTVARATADRGVGCTLIREYDFFGIREVARSGG